MPLVMKVSEIVKKLLFSGDGTMKRTMAMMLSVALVGSVIPAQAQQDSAAPANPAHKRVAKPAGPTITTQLGEMKQAIEAQQAQIKALSDLIQSRDQKIQVLEQRLGIFRRMISRLFWPLDLQPCLPSIRLCRLFQFFAEQKQDPRMPSHRSPPST